MKALERHYRIKAYRRQGANAAADEAAIARCDAHFLARGRAILGGTRAEEIGRRIDRILGDESRRGSPGQQLGPPMPCWIPRGRTDSLK